ncbi:Uncharacterised protein [Mycobacteroides abscessus subsp. abscessus]|nr:Uncharacterised protein [Mycobacteroides abscessus subsp. abscessus]
MTGPRRMPVRSPFSFLSISTSHTRSGMSAVRPRVRSPALLKATTLGIRGAHA